MDKIEMLKIGKSIIEDYNLGKSCMSLSKKYGVSSCTISKFLKKNGISIINRQNEQFGLNKDIFSVIDTEEKAYWLGFLYADGNISSSSNRISIALKESDRSHLEKFKKFIDGNINILYKKSVNACVISFRCKEMKKDLVSLGCVPNKTWIINSIPNIKDELKIHFIRGFFDGDGCITYGNKKKDGKYCISINIVSNKNMLQSICNFFNENKNFTSKKKY
jgi:intein-encoded DNA endonuclease-like protein